MFDSSTDFQLSNAIESIKLAQQVHKRELEKRDDKVKKLLKKIEHLQSENRELTKEFNEFRETKEEEFSQIKDLISAKQFMEQKLSKEQEKNSELREELAKTKRELEDQEEKFTTLQNENEKANHIIKNLLKKVNGLKITS